LDARCQIDCDGKCSSVVTTGGDVAQYLAMSISDEDLPEWERLLAAERHLQSIVPGAVLV